jgi:hypothetical protein
MPSNCLILFLASGAAAVALQPPPLPLTGDNGEMGGIFGMGARIPGFLSTFSFPVADGTPAPTPAQPAPPRTSSGSFSEWISDSFTNLANSVDISWLVPVGTEYPKGKITAKDFYDPGTGPYPAKLYGELLANHTVYAPINPPKGVKLATVLWGECSSKRHES